MITLLASIAGFITSILPELLKYLRDKSDKAHELAMLDRQIEFTRVEKNAYIQEIGMSHDMEKLIALTSVYKSGIAWVDALNGSVRPMLAYSFFMAYVLIKYMQYQTLIMYGPGIDYIEIIWNNDDRAIFAGIISFYYGQKTVSKTLKR